MSGADVVAKAADGVIARCSIERPTIGLILGSGLGGFARRIEKASRVAFGEIPGLATTSIEGHAGELVHGWIGTREIIALSGRLHLYEGYPASTVSLPVRVLHALGVRTVFVSNAAGGIRDGLDPGTFMILRDHINLAWRNPLIGRPARGEERFPDMSEPYDSALRGTFHDAATAAGLSVMSGVYASVLGPSYETPAEVRMLARMGADAVGMSTVPEVLVARALGMRILAVSCITNRAAGLSARPLTHAEVLATSARVAPAFERALTDWIGLDVGR